MKIIQKMEKAVTDQKGKFPMFKGYKINLKKLFSNLSALFQKIHKLS